MADNPHIADREDDGDKVIDMEIKEVHISNDEIARA